MSVINKMLRDLDQHKAAAAVTVPPGVRATGTNRQHSAPRSKPWALGAVMLMVLVLGVWLGAGLGRTTPVAVPDAVRAPMPATDTLAQPTPSTPGASATPAVPHAKASSAKPTANATSSHMATAKTLSKPALAVATTVAPVAVPAATPPVIAHAPSKGAEPARVPPSAPVVNGHAVDPAPPPAGRHALAQAQSLWREGAQTAAFELLRGALVWSHSAATPPDQATLAAMAREHARMALVLGQGAETLVLLKQLEPRLSGVAEVWATRGQVAQRLGQHAEAVRSYQQALALGPSQPRWMLGAAISLAVQGQLGQAAEWAEHARALGGLTPEVRAYLAQLGVSVRLD